MLFTTSCSKKALQAPKVIPAIKAQLVLVEPAGAAGANDVVDRHRQ